MPTSSFADEPKLVDKKKPADDQSNDAQARRAHVKKAIKRVKDAKEHYSEDYDRMRANMDFVAGFQWDGQKTLTSKDYVINMTLKTINQRVATLYARNPKVAASRRPRMEFQVWDGKIETIQQAFDAVQQAATSGGQPPMEAVALLQDFQHGRAQEVQIERVGRTLELAYQYQQDTQVPRFKTQMKQLVRRTAVCGVGYVKVSFCREEEPELTQSETRLSVYDRGMEAKRILDEVEKGDISKTDAEIQELKMLVESLDMAPNNGEGPTYQERLVFDFPQSTSIIPDPDCRLLRGFVGAHWVAEEFRYPLNFVNAFFGKDIEASDIKLTDNDGKTVEVPTGSDGDSSDDGKVTLWVIRDIDMKSEYIVCDGYDDYLREPEVISPTTKNFWNIFTVIFNDIEVDEECKATIFPPSDVDLIKHPQKEWNRCRNALRRHRVANRPRAMYAQGALHDEDLDAISKSDDQEFIALRGLQPGVEPGKVLQPLLLTPLDERMYDTNPLQEDVLLGTGAQEANIGPAQPNVTATVGTIAEQSRIGVANCDIDGLDDTLSDLAQAGAELMLREMSSATIKEIVGPGAVWPEENREPFINGIDLSIVAASSGRPNKALEISNWERLVPLIIQAVQMPPQAQPTIQAILRETIKRADDNLDPAEFFPLAVPPTQGPPPKGPSISFSASDLSPDERAQALAQDQIRATPGFSSPKPQPKKQKPTPVNGAGQSVPMMG